jgi:hypothetical protein
LWPYGEGESARELLRFCGAVVSPPAGGGEVGGGEVGGGETGGSNVSTVARDAAQVLGAGSNVSTAFGLQFTVLARSLSGDNCGERLIGLAGHA